MIDDAATSIQTINNLLEANKTNYDVAIGVTHWAIETDMLLIQSNINNTISLIVGGHEHENYSIRRGINQIPIHKADSNAASAWIHRIAVDLKTKKEVIIQSHLQIIDEKISADTRVKKICEDLFAEAMNAFENNTNSTINPHKIVATIPKGQSLDGRSSIVRSDRSALMNKLVCNSLVNDAINNTHQNDKPRIGIVNTGTIRVDDVLYGDLTEYDVLRIIPFRNFVTVISVNESLLYETLYDPSNTEGNGMFLATCGDLSFDTSTSTWMLSNKPLISSGNQATTEHNVALTEYLLEETNLGKGKVAYTGHLHSLALMAELAKWYNQTS
jgi:5'-nucleotidase